MGYLNRKLRRDIVRNWTQFFSVFLMAFLSVLVYVGLEGAWHGMETNLNSYMSESNLADSWVSAVNFTKEDIDAFKNISGVDDVSASTRIQVDAGYKGTDIGYLNLQTLGTGKISISNCISGESLNSSSSGIWVNEWYAQQHGVIVGDEISISYYGQTVQVPVMGLIISPDRMYYTGVPEFAAPESNLFGYGIIGETVLTEQLHYKNGNNFLAIKETQGNVRNEASKILGEKYISYFNRSTLSDVSTALDRVGQIRNLSILFSCIFILLSILAMYTTIKRLIETQAGDIATLKAIGYSSSAIGWHYASFGIFIGGVGSVLALMVAPGMSLFVLGSQKVSIALPEWSIAYTWATPLLMITITLICTASAFLASSKSRHGLPAIFMRTNAANKSHRSSLERFKWLWNKINYGSRWAWRDATANPIRVLMGIVGVCGGMMLLITGFGAPDSMHAQVTDTFGRDFSYFARAKIIGMYSAEEKDAIQKDYDGQLLQVVSTRITPDDGYDRVLTILGRGDLVNLVTTDGKSIEDDGIFITEGAAKMTGIDVGQTIEITVPLDENKYKFIVKGILASSIPQGVYITRSTWEKAEGLFNPQDLLVDENTSIVRMKSDSRLSQVIAIADQQNNAKEFIAGFEGIFMLILSFAIILAIVVLYNLGALSFSERLRDYATLRVLGYHRREIRSLAMRENILTTLIGLAIGIPAGYWFLSQYIGEFNTHSIVYYPNLTTVSLIVASAIAILCSLTTTFLIGRRIQKIDMVEATKGIE